jgi:hypothetical protein
VWWSPLTDRHRRARNDKFFVTVQVATKAKYEFITSSEKEENNVPLIKRVLKE